MKKTISIVAGLAMAAAFLPAVSSAHNRDTVKTDRSHHQALHDWRVHDGIAREGIAIHHRAHRVAGTITSVSTGGFQLTNAENATLTVLVNSNTQIVSGDRYLAPSELEIGNQVLVKTAITDQPSTVSARVINVQVINTDN